MGDFLRRQFSPVWSARQVNIAVVAEGVEDLRSARALRDMGVDYLQGFYFSKPKPPEECKLFVEATHAAAPNSEVTELQIEPGAPG